MAGIQQVSFTSPYTAEEQDIARRRQLAELLQAKGAEGVGPTEMVGGWAIKKSPLEGLGKMAQQLSGAYQGNQADQLAKQLGERQRGDRTSDMNALAAMLKGAPASPGVDDPTAGYSPPTAARPGGQIDPAMLGNLKSPEMQNTAMQMFIQQMQRENAPPEMKDLGDRIGLIKNGQIVGYLPKGVTPDTAAKEAGDQRRFEGVSGNAQLGSQTTLATHATPSGSTLASNAVAMRGQNMTDARAQQTLNSGKWTNDLERGLQVNTATGETRPITASGEPIGKKDKDLTDAQSKALLYSNRMKEAEDALTALTAKGVNVSVPGSRAGYGVGAALNTVNSEDRQKLDQAKRNFINAVLRRESGAVIAQSEFDNAEQQYFPQVGDKPGTIAQKSANRKTAFEGIQAEVPGAKRPAGYAGPERRTGGATVKWDDLK